MNFFKQFVGTFFCIFLGHKPRIEQSGYYTKCVRCGITLYIDDEFITELNPYCNCKCEDCISCNYYKTLE